MIQVIREMNPWRMFCWTMIWLCTKKAKFWFLANHPYWDCSTGSPQQWSIKKYGERPQERFYRQWESRRALWLKMINETRPTFEQIERQAVRKKYGLDDYSAPEKKVDSQS